MVARKNNISSDEIHCNVNITTKDMVMTFANTEV